MHGKPFNDRPESLAHGSVPVSLSRSAAARQWRRFRALPLSLRQPQRCRPVARALVRYALEALPDGQPRPVGAVLARLQEFLPPEEGWWLLGWLADGQLDEAWQQPGQLVALLGWCLARPSFAGGHAG